MVGLPVGLEDMVGFPVGVDDGTFVGAGLTLGSAGGSSYRILIFTLNAIPNSEVIISPNTVSISAAEGTPGGAPDLQWHVASPSFSSKSMRYLFSTAVTPDSTELGEEIKWRSRSIG